jgi:hypothetical protein
MTLVAGAAIAAKSGTLLPGAAAPASRPTEFMCPKLVARTLDEKAWVREEQDARLQIAPTALTDRPIPGASFFAAFQPALPVDGIVVTDSASIRGLREATCASSRRTA